MGIEREFLSPPKLDLPSEPENRIALGRLLLEDPSFFTEHLLRIKPFPYQRKFLNDPSKRIVTCAGRQIGKTTVTSAKAIWFALTHRAVTILIVSKGLRQSMKMFDTILGFIYSSDLIRQEVTYKSRTRIFFTNNSKIIALPCGSDGGTLRGETAHMIVADEADFMPEVVITSVALPMLATTGGTMILLSTPWDKSHIFYQAFTSDGWSHHHFPSSINPLITKEFLDEQLEEIGINEFKREYLAEFPDDERAFFPMSLLKECIHHCESETQCDYCQKYGITLSGELYVGYDPGGKVDPAAFLVLQRISNATFRVVLTKTFLAKYDGDRNNLYTNFTVLLADLHKKFRFRKVLIDITGLGEGIIEIAKQAGLPAEGINLGLRNKEEILTRLHVLFESKKVVLQPDDLTLISNLNCIEVDRMATGGYKFDHPKKTHDDLAFALAMAAYAATKSSGSVAMIQT